MNAEGELLELVALVDDARARGDDEAIRLLEGRIRELKAVSGPRQIEGSGSMNIPPPSAAN